MYKICHEFASENKECNTMPSTNKESSDCGCHNGGLSPLSQPSSENEKSSPESSGQRKQKHHHVHVPTNGIEESFPILNGLIPTMNGYTEEMTEENACEASGQMSGEDVGQGDSHIGTKSVKSVKMNGMTSPKAVRPKTMSWSRTVKHRRDQKEKEKKDGNKNERYIYPELGSSSDESCEFYSCNAGRKKSDRKKRADSSSGSGLDDKESSESVLDDHVINDASSTSSHEQVTFSSGIDLNVQNVNILPECSELTVESLVMSAPLAVPEDSDGSSPETGCDKCDKTNVENDLETFSTSETLTSVQNVISDDKDGDNDTLNNDLLLSEEQNEGEFTHVSSSESLEEIADEDNSSEIQENKDGLVVEEITRKSSSDSLDEIGDYIETDFPSRASRHMFASSSQDSSTSSDEDEGYGCVESNSLCPENSKDNPSKTNTEIQRSSPDPEVPPENVSFCSEPVFSHRNFSCNVGASNLWQDVVSPSADTNIVHSRPRINTKPSDDGSEESPLLCSPETDFSESLDSDLPTSATSTQQMFRFSQDLDRLVCAEIQDCPPTSELCSVYEPLDFCTNDLRGAEGGMTNDLSMRRHSFDFDDVECNMETFDPHISVNDNENFNYPDVCKQEKVPQANFKNSESNRQEKVFFKLALEKDNCSSRSESSDEEENLGFHFHRERLLNVGLGRLSQNGENDQCLVLEDLENPTHAVRNAVIMPLPNKLEESSGESSEDPIYEDIDCLDSLSVGENLQVVREDNCDNTVKTVPKFERPRRRRSHRHSDVEKVMIWHEYEAYLLQVKQIGTSACGPTAVLTVLKAFDYQVDKDEVCKKIITNTRMETAPICYYLFSRSIAGTTAEQLIDGVNKLTKGAIRARFFHFYPPRKVELLKWLGHWMKKGAVPIATLNLQRGVKPGWAIPDAWHHQMIYGVSSKGVYLTNPLEIASEETIMEQLTSDSVLMIRRQDVVNRFRDWSPLNDLVTKKDERWNTMNVLGQVVNVLREACTAMYHQVPHYRAQLTSHITIPAAYKAGITLFVRQNTDVAQELFNAPELELRD